MILRSLVALGSLAGMLTPAAGAAPTEGIWRTDGYSMVVSAGDGRLRLYETTATGCVAGDVGKEQAERGVYTLSDGTVLTLRPGAHARRARMLASGSSGERGLIRIGGLPAACAKSPPSDPVSAFDMFWRTFAENYPFFASKGVDWAEVRDRHRPKVGQDTTPDQLFTIFRDMIEPLGDAHTAVIAGERFFAGLRPGTRDTTAAFGRKVKAHIDRRDLGGRGRDHASGHLRYADLPGGIGYLRVSSFYGYATGDDFDFLADSAVLAKALDGIFTPARIRALRGLIVDVRFNPGGFDMLGLQLAARLTAKPYLAYHKRARNDPDDPAKFTPPQRITVKPAATGYTGPVALLTADTTVSAGETFTQAMMERPGRTVRIGQPTQGVFSDIMQRTLPNGMQLWVPNEEFLTKAGTTYDGAGVPPHIRTPVFTEEEFAADRDSAFDRALRVLRGGR
ncbi:protease [Spongiactinospora rosea]|uniref:Protease n=1 Tax=Spongiactinospora rosea TaxID=2248750 RepID=A0A366M0U3_9ACTN|nr:S41 family peptidase [Spongiactinospora rosea]RBQ19403.1 protease [Spongiactinospora rosea]